MRLRFLFRVKVASVASVLACDVPSFFLARWLALASLPVVSSRNLSSYQWLAALDIGLTVGALAGLGGLCYFPLRELRALRSMGALRSDYLVGSLGLVAGLPLVTFFIGSI